jgi:DNA polymerase-3 subunit epsilon
MLEDLPETPSPTPPVWPVGYPDGYAVVDVETTGLGRDDRIVSAAVYRLDGRGEVQDHWYSPVNPQRDPGPVWIHGLTSEVLADAPLFPEIAGELAERLAGRVLVAHNAAFDWAMLAREYARADRVVPVEQRLCTIVLSKELRLPLPNHKLESLAAHYGVVQRRAHHALDDARVLAEAFRPSLHLAAEAGIALPLHACLPITEWVGRDAAGGSRSGGHGSGSGSPGSGFGGYGGYRPTSWRQRRRLPACPYPNPGRLAPDGPLVQGMRVAFSGDTTVERELLEDRATEAGLHVSGSVSRLTSVLVTNDPGAPTTKAANARRFGTPMVDEARFGELLRSVAPAPAAAAPGRLPEPRGGRE